MTLEQWLAIGNFAAALFIPAMTGLIVVLHKANARRWDAVEKRLDRIENRLWFRAPPRREPGDYDP